MASGENPTCPFRLYSDWKEFKGDGPLDADRSNMLKEVAKEQELLIRTLNESVQLKEEKKAKLNKRIRDLKDDIAQLKKELEPNRRIESKLDNVANTQTVLVGELKDTVNSLVNQMALSIQQFAREMQVGTESQRSLPAILPSESGESQFENFPKFAKGKPPNSMEEVTGEQMEVTPGQTQSVGIGTDEDFPLKEPPETCSVGVGTEEEWTVLAVLVPKQTRDAGTATNEDFPQPPETMIVGEEDATNDDRLSEPSTSSGSEQMEADCVGDNDNDEVTAPMPELVADTEQNQVGRLEENEMERFLNGLFSPAEIEQFREAARSQMTEDNGGISTLTLEMERTVVYTDGPTASEPNLGGIQEQGPSGRQQTEIVEMADDDDDDEVVILTPPPAPEPTRAPKVEIIELDMDEEDDEIVAMPSSDAPAGILENVAVPVPLPPNEAQACNNCPRRESSELQALRAINGGGGVRGRGRGCRSPRLGPLPNRKRGSNEVSKLLAAQTLFDFSGIDCRSDGARTTRAMLRKGRNG